MKNVTLADRIAGFSKIRLGKVTVKVPKLSVKTKPRPQISKNEIPVSSIVNILIKNAIEKTKKDKKEKLVDEDKSYKIVKDDKPEINGGYGTASKSYGMSPKASYADYGKMFSHLGAFRAKQPYDDMAEHLGNNNKALDDRGFVLVSSEAMEKGKFYIRYFNSKVPIAKNSLVPLAPGMNSKDWEEFIWFMRLDTAMYLLKISTS